jgi:hypothetical protein
VSKKDKGCVPLDILERLETASAEESGELIKKYLNSEAAKLEEKIEKVADGKHPMSIFAACSSIVLRMVDFMYMSYSDPTILNLTDANVEHLIERIQKIQSLKRKGIHGLRAFYTNAKGN